MGIAGLTAPLLVPPPAKSAPREAARDCPLTIVRPLAGEWQFRLDPKSVGKSQGWHLPSASSDGWSTVTVPHTWQVSEDSAGYLGVAWYRCTFELPESWSGKVIRLECEAVFHSAVVWLNGEQVGSHLRKGYTSFAFDISAAALPGQANTITVKVDNSFDQNMLPRGNSYDWTPDGGIIRPVSLLISPKTFIERVDVDAQPDLTTSHASLAIRVTLGNSGSTEKQIQIAYEILEEDTDRVVLRMPRAATASLKPEVSEEVSLPPGVLPNPRLWHFDHPHLYRLAVTIEADGESLHSCSTTFGVRKIEVRDGGFYFNGERVWIMGVERMAGSNPEYGMAEPSAWILHDHNDLKELNCVFTRVHWQQDRTGPRLLRPARNSAPRGSADLGGPNVQWHGRPALAGNHGERPRAIARDDPT